MIERELNIVMIEVYGVSLTYGCSHDQWRDRSINMFTHRPRLSTIIPSAGKIYNLNSGKQALARRSFCTKHNSRHNYSLYFCLLLQFISVYMKSFTAQEQSIVYVHTYTSPSESLAGLYFSLNWETELLLLYSIYILLIR